MNSLWSLLIGDTVSMMLLTAFSVLVFPDFQRSHSASFKRTVQTNPSLGNFINPKRFGVGIKIPSCHQVESLKAQTSNLTYHAIESLAGSLNLIKPKEFLGLVNDIHRKHLLSRHLIIHSNKQSAWLQEREACYFLELETFMIILREVKILRKVAQLQERYWPILQM